MLGLLAGLKSLTVPVTGAPEGVAQDPISGVYLLLMIGVATGLMLLLLKFKKNFLISAWFYSAIFLTMLVFFSVFVSAPLAIAITLTLFLTRYFTDELGLRNIIDMFSFAGAGALFGTMIGFVPALIFLFVLAIYDIISVFVTGHMIDLAKGGLSTDTFMGIVFADEEIPDETEAKDMEVPESSESEGEVKEAGISIVGGGDVIAPMILSVSLLKNFPLYSSVMTSLGSVVGLLVLMNYKSEKQFLPAIPTVAGFAVLGFLLSLPLVIFI